MNLQRPQTADVLPRRAFSAEDVRRMVEAGILAHDERIELIEGDLVPMAAKGYAHELIKNELVMRLAQVAGGSVLVGVENTLQLSADVLVEPDILVYRRGDARPSAERFMTLAAERIIVAIEIAASSLIYDRGRKAALYARHGIPLYWVIDAQERTTFVHRDPGPDGYASVEEIGPGALLAVALGGEHPFQVRLADIC